MLFRDDGLIKFDTITSTRGFYYAFSIGKIEFKSVQSVYPVHVSLSIANNASRTIQNVTEETIEILSIDRNMVNWIIHDKYIRTYTYKMFRQHWFTI